MTGAREARNLTAETTPINSDLGQQHFESSCLGQGCCVKSHAAGFASRAIEPTARDSTQQPCPKGTGLGSSCWVLFQDS